MGERKEEEMNRWIPRSWKRARRRKERAAVGIVVLAGILLIISAVKLIDYNIQKSQDEMNTEEMRADALQSSSLSSDPSIAGTYEVSSLVSAEISPAPLRDENEKPGKTDDGQLAKAEYSAPAPDFSVLKNRYPDFIGWLKIEGEIDEPVVQRDNEFFLDHDARGNENINGALFLDAIVDLNTRPYSLIIYGHNMRSGAKFGNLYRYEENSYFTAHKDISFDTIYESGTYEVFATGVFRTENIDIFFLNTLDIAERNRMIESLRENAVMDSGAEIGAADQLLILITCVDDDAERRFVAAKRV